MINPSLDTGASAKAHPAVRSFEDDEDNRTQGKKTEWRGLAVEHSWRLVRRNNSGEHSEQLQVATQHHAWPVAITVIKLCLALEGKMLQVLVDLLPEQPSSIEHRPPNNASGSAKQCGWPSGCPGQAESKGSAHKCAGGKAQHNDLTGIPDV
ncbi:hypothetical protein SRHO_G00112850 [Serrasalmus rhombeus]